MTYSAVWIEADEAFISCQMVKECCALCLVFFFKNPVRINRVDVDDVF